MQNTYPYKKWILASQYVQKYILFVLLALSYTVLLIRYDSKLHNHLITVYTLRTENSILKALAFQRLSSKQNRIVILGQNIKTMAELYGALAYIYVRVWLYVRQQMNDGYVAKTDCIIYKS